MGPLPNGPTSWLIRVTNHLLTGMILQLLRDFEDSGEEDLRDLGFAI